MAKKVKATSHQGDSQSGRVQPSLVFVDADNTLWDTNALYAKAQLRLLAGVEQRAGVVAAGVRRLAFVRAIDQCLAERHHRHLRYPISFLIRALDLALSGIPAERAARLAWSRASEPGRLSAADIATLEAQFIAELSVIPRLRRGVRQGLSELCNRDCRVLVLTEGSIARVQSTAATLAIDHYVERIVEVKKEQRTFARMHKALGAPAHVFMVGDQLERDIRPAQLAGLMTVFFPGAFHPRWERLAGDIVPDFVIRSFAELPKIVSSTSRP